jgi:uncharacterized protein YaaN involved in tellurite resistance
LRKFVLMILGGLLALALAACGRPGLESGGEIPFDALYDPACQMVIALGMHRSQEALKAQTAVTDMTNELLKKNAAALKMGTIETAREAERGIIDLDTLISTNQSLIDTINEVMKIQDEGRAQRLTAEKQMIDMESQLKAKLLELKH